jgi:hypothetical protein
MTPTFSTAAERRAYHYSLDPIKYQNEHRELFSRGNERAMEKELLSNIKPLERAADEAIAFYTTKKKRDEAAWKEINKVVIKKAE